MVDPTQSTPPVTRPGVKPAEAAPNSGNDFSDVQSGSSSHDIQRPGFWHRAFNTVGRAVTGAADELSNSVVNLGAEIGKASFQGSQPKIPGFIDRLTGGSDVPATGKQEKNRQAFLDWYAQGDEKRNPAQFGNERREGWFGHKGEDSIGWAEDILQFSIGMFTANKALKGLGIGAGLGERLAGQIGRTQLAAAVSDYAFMDPYENNLVNIISHAPDEQSSAFAKFFGASHDDPEAVNRLKSALGGFIVGKALDQVLSSARAVWLWRKAKALPLGSAERDALEGRIAKVVEEGAVQGPAQNVGKMHIAADFEVMQDATGKFRLAHKGELMVDSPEFVRAADANMAAASLNESVPRATRDLTDVTKQVSDNIKNGAAPDNIPDLTRDVDFRFEDVSEPTKAESWIAAVTKVAEDAMHPTPRSWETAGKEAQFLFGGSTPQEAMGIASEFTKKTKGLDSYVIGLKAYVNKAGEYISRVSERVDQVAGANPVDVEKLRIALGTMFDVVPKLREGAAEIGRGLNAFKNEASEGIGTYVTAKDGSKLADVGAEDVAKAAKDAGPAAPSGSGIFSGLTKTDILALARNLRLSEGDPEVIIKMLGVSPKPPKPGSALYNAYQTVRYNGMLSAPITHIGNAASNLLMMVSRSVETAMGGLVEHNKEQLMQGVDELGAHFHNAWDALQWAGKAFRMGRTILDPKAVQYGEADAAAQAAANAAGPAGQGWLSKLFNMPSRLLMTTDEFFKQMNYRASVVAQGYQDARRIFPNAPEKWGNHVAETLRGAFNAEGGAVNTVALERAKENTFTNDLVGWAAETEKFLGNGPIRRHFFPFRKTPINIFLAAAERTPVLWRVSQRMQSELAEGGVKAASARAKLEFGQNLWTFTAGMAAAGNFTGGGPKDPERRRQLLATGWKPYSVKMPGGGYVSYQRIEPFATLFGMAADATEVFADLAQQGNEKDHFDLISSFVMGAAENVYNKSFLKGLSDITSLGSGQASAGQKLLANAVSQVVPFGSLLNSANPDPVMRDVRSVQDRVLSRFPIYSTELEPVRSFLGEPLPKLSWTERNIWPFASDKPGDSPRQKLMKDVIDGIGEQKQLPMPSAVVQGNNLRDRDRWAAEKTPHRQSPYDRMLELYSTGIKASEDYDALPPMEEALKAVVHNDVPALKKMFPYDYDKLGYWSKALPSDGVDGSDSEINTRLGIVRGLAEKYRKAAYAQVLKEYPKLAQAVQQADSVRAARKDARGDNQLKAFLNKTTP